jgi:flagellar basal body-associated protein FliL
MFEDRRKIIIIALVALLVLVLGLILWWFLSSRSKVPASTVNLGGSQVVAVTPASEGSVVQPATPERVQQEKSYPLGLKQLAMSFAERYGSYSTDEPVANLADLRPFMTNNFASQVIGKNQLDSITSFVGFSTKALTADLPEVTPTKATIIVGTQRTQEFGDGQASKTFYAKLKLSAIMEGNEWKIDGAVWQ